MRHLAHTWVPGPEELALDSTGWPLFQAAAAAQRPSGRRTASVGCTTTWASWKGTRLRLSTWETTSAAPLSCAVPSSATTSTCCGASDRWPPGVDPDVRGACRAHFDACVETSSPAAHHRGRVGLGCGRAGRAPRAARDCELELKRYARCVPGADATPRGGAPPGADAGIPRNADGAGVRCGAAELARLAFAPNSTPSTMSSEEGSILTPARW